jgi:hypothetical protein
MLEVFSSNRKVHLFIHRQRVPLQIVAAKLHNQDVSIIIQVCCVKLMKQNVI